MNASRRQVLKTLLKSAGAATVVAGGALGWRAHQVGLLDSEPSPFDAWSAFGDAPAGDPLGIVGAAVLASNPHNTQPWSFRVAGGQIDLYADASRHLGSFDPFLREMWLGLGCAVENMVQAAGGKGFAIDALQALPGAAGPSHAARLVLRPRAATASPLHAAITQRRTNRAGYRMDRAVPQSVLDLMAALPSSADTRLVLIPATAEPGRAFAEATVAATAAINADRTMSLDSHRWFRPNARAVALNRDGVSLPTAGLGAAFTVAGQLLPPTDDRAASDYWLQSTRRQVDSTPWFGMIAVRDLYDRRQQLEAGRLWQRLHLALTAAGLAAQPINQTIELVDRERQTGRAPAAAQALARWTGNDWRATFAFRFGTPEVDVPHAARRRLADVVTAARTA
jgi:nitroreductase